MNKTSVEKKTKFDFIRYASVWEDADLLCKALESVGKGGRLLSIASSGDNAPTIAFLCIKIFTHTFPLKLQTSGTIIPN